MAKQHSHKLPADLQRHIVTFRKTWVRFWEQDDKHQRALAELGKEYERLFYRWRERIGWRGTERDFVYDVLLEQPLCVWREFLSDRTYLRIQRARRAAQRGRGVIKP